MGLTMKNFNFKTLTLISGGGGGGHEKPIERWGLPKGGLGQCADLRGAWQERGG